MYTVITKRFDYTLTKEDGTHTEVPIISETNFETLEDINDQLYADDILYITMDED